MPRSILDDVPTELVTKAADAFRRGQEATKKYERRCEQCGDEFQTSQPARRFCDSDCRAAFFNGGGKAAPTASPPPGARKGRPSSALSSELADAERRIAEQAETILKLQRAISAAERRAELAEASVRRAYAFAAANGRR